jgi:hypothetical protein
MTLKNFVTTGVLMAALDIPVGAIGPTRARCLDKLRRRLDEQQADLR